MRRAGMTALARFHLLGFTVVVFATAIAVSVQHPDARTEGRMKMTDAQYRPVILMR